MNLKNLKNIKCVYFDLGGVVFNFSGGLDSISEKLSIPISEVTAYWKSQDDAVCLGKISAQNFWDNLLTHFSLSHDNLDFINFWTDHFHPIIETHRAIHTLQSKGIKIGILTNIYKGVYEIAIKKGHIPNIEYLSVIKSCDVELVKPDPKIFNYALAQVDLQPSEVLLIDDREENINAANKLGWETLLYVKGALN